MTSDGSYGPVPYSRDTPPLLRACDKACNSKRKVPARPGPARWPGPLARAEGMEGPARETVRRERACGKVNS